MSPERLLNLLRHQDPAKRRKAVLSLEGLDPVEAIPLLLRIRREEEDDEVRELARNELRRLGAVLDLTTTGADQWFDQVRSSSPAFETLCDVMGERFVGYALIVGLQISGLTVDQFNPANTVIEFHLLESEPPRAMRLPEFRRELVRWLLAEAPQPKLVGLPLDMSKAQQLIGVRYILLAPLHDISLEELILVKPGKKPRARVVLRRPGEEPEEVDIPDLWAELRDAVNAELEATRDRPFELDFSLIDQAEEAARRGDWEEVQNLIGHWPGPLSMLGRMQMAATLDEEKRGRVGQALGYLAAAYRATGRSAWAEELHRLGLQFAGDTAAAAELYMSLGEAMLEEQRFGEAIGPLRRALKLGTELTVVGPALGLALLQSERLIGAAAILEKALLDGASEQRVLPLLRAVYSRLGDRASLLRELHSDWVGDQKLEGEMHRVTPPRQLVDGSESTLEVVMPGGEPSERSTSESSTMATMRGGDPAEDAEAEGTANEDGGAAAEDEGDEARGNADGGDAPDGS